MGTLLVTTIDGETTTSTGQASTQTMEVSGPLMLMEQHFGKQTMSKLMSSSSWTPSRWEPSSETCLINILKHPLTLCYLNLCCLILNICFNIIPFFPCNIVYFM